MTADADLSVEAAAVLFDDAETLADALGTVRDSTVVIDPVNDDVGVYDPVNDDVSVYDPVNDDEL